MRFFCYLLILGWCARLLAQPELVNPEYQPPADPLAPTIAELRQADPAVRVKAAERLGTLPDPRCVALLAETMRDGDARVRMAAVRAYRNFTDPPLEPVLAAAGDLEPEVRIEAVLSLWMRQHAAGIPPAMRDVLLAASRDADDKVRFYAIDLLGRAGGAWAVAPLIRAAEDHNVYLRCWAVRALGGVAGLTDDPQPVAALLAALRDQDAGVRTTAAEALEPYGDPRALASLLAAARDPVAGVRATVLRTLRNCDDPRVLAAARTAAGDADPGVRAAAAQVLGCRREAEAAPLLAMLDDDDYEVRLAAAAALAQRGDARALEPLAGMLSEREWSRFERSFTALATLGAPGYPALAGVLRDPRRDARDYAVRALAQLRPDPRLLDLYLPLLQDPDSQRRLAGVRLLDGYREPRVTAALLAAQTDPDPAVRQAVGLLLARCRPTDPAAVEPLLRLLRDADVETRHEAAGALARLGAHALAPLRALATDADPAARLAALDALGRMPAEEARAIVFDALRDEHAGVRTRAVELIGVWRDPKYTEALLAMQLDANPAVVTATIRALGACGDARALESLIAHAQAGAARAVAIEALAALLHLHPDPRGLAVFKAALLGDALSLRRAALAGLPALGRQAGPLAAAALQGTNRIVLLDTLAVLTADAGPQVVKPLIALLDDREAQVREKAITLLGALRDDRAVAPLLGALAKERLPAHRAAAAAALGRIGDPRAVEPLLALLRDERAPDLRASALTALGQLGDRRALPALRIAARDRDDHLRATALDALQRLTDQKAGR